MSSGPPSSTTADEEMGACAADLSTCVAPCTVNAYCGNAPITKTTIAKMTKMKTTTTRLDEHQLQNKSQYV